MAKLASPERPSGPHDRFQSCHLASVCLSVKSKTHSTSRSLTVTSLIYRRYAIPRSPHHYSHVTLLSGFKSLGQSSSDIKVLGPTDTQGTITITIDDNPLVVPSTSEHHDRFSTFNVNLTQQTESSFRLVGQARAVANMSIGTITLDPIKFDVPSQLVGLDGLRNATTIESVDVLGGTSEALTLAINVSIHNPSNLNLYTGNLTMQLYRGDDYMGTALLPHLNLTMGENSIQGTAAFDPNASDGGRETLNDFVGGTGQDISLLSSSCIRPS